MSRLEPVVQLKHLQDLYDRHRYLDAFALTSEYWKDSTVVQRLSTEEVILGGRLAARLGGQRLSRWLFREAARRDPRNRQARYFARHLRSREYLLDELKDFNAEPDLGGDDPKLRASWCASYAITWATLRDFDRSYQCLKIAHSLSPDDGWVLSCESAVFGLADRRTEALRSAERAWEVDPGSPFAAHSLGMSLLKLGHAQQAAGIVERIRFPPCSPSNPLG